MKRSLCAFALLALAAIPDWASACWLPRRERAAYRSAYGWRPAYRQAIYRQPISQPVYVQTRVPPTQPTVLPPPRIEPVKLSGSDASAAEPSRPLARPEPAPPTQPIQTIGGKEPTRVTPEPKLPPPDPKITAEPKIPPLELPKNTEPKLPPLELPKMGGEPKLPPLELPTKPDPNLPPIELPKETSPKLPPLVLPKETGSKPLEPTKPTEPKSPSELPGAGTAVPVPAPPPDILTPPTGDPKVSNSLPPLVLPPDTPVAPAPKPTVVKSSPLMESRELKVSVFPATGATDLRSPLRKVGFFNHTDRDLMLTIEGKTVKLPAKTFIHAQVPTTFTWKLGDKPTTTATVPADAAGLDVLFRE